MASTTKLPDYIPPMLAQSAEPFDSPDHLFEIKWDGTRAMLFVDAEGYRLVNRRRYQIAERYPELEFLGTLPPGIVLDGEIVVLRDGRPDFTLLLSREQARTELRRRAAALEYPATYIVFDQLYACYESLEGEPLELRRERLRETVSAAASPRLVYSDGITGGGRAYFERASEQGLEGVVAKRLGSRYHAGERSDAWLKIKPRLDLLCAIIGYVENEDGRLRSLIIATNEDGELRAVGKVGSGINDRMHGELTRLLRERQRRTPLIPCSIDGKWVEPGLYCKVTYHEKTKSGQLRAPVFKELVVE